MKINESFEHNNNTVQKKKSAWELRESWKQQQQQQQPRTPKTPTTSDKPPTTPKKAATPSIPPPPPLEEDGESSSTTNTTPLPKTPLQGHKKTVLQHDDTAMIPSTPTRRSPQKTPRKLKIALQKQNDFANAIPTLFLAATTTTTTSKKPKKKKRVTFHRGVACKLVPNLDSYSSETLELLWYDAEECDAMMQEQKDILKQLLYLDHQHQHHVDNDDFCVRGLEYQTPQGFEKRLSRKVACYQDVMSEQDRQWTDGIFDEDAIAAIYLKHSIPAIQDAHTLGLQDQVQAVSTTSTTSSSKSPKQQQQQQQQQLLLPPKSPQPRSSNNNNNTSNSGSSNSSELMGSSSVPNRKPGRVFSSEANSWKP